ncbi:hypothetical protein GCM10010964_43730 [Caldovatus sediminis]|uniref:Lipoprotein n=1 Tax=Caldovatus sediminis TaxID=2041189 RepID=A0A8J3EE85_9PROT|nr:hypothetical protein GCM10010964_43730 [Caldovatus sediminis]
MRRSSATALLAALSSACATAPSEPRLPRPFCPPLAVYDREAQRRALAEMEQLAGDSELRRMLSDYHELRVRIRGVCW